MACFGGKSRKQVDDSQIERDLKAERRARQLLVSILLLGAGNSGKSTFARQLCYLNPSTDRQNYMEYREDLKQNTLDSARLIVQALDEWRVKVPNLTPEMKEGLMKAPELTREQVKAIKILYDSTIVKQIIDERGDEMMLCSGVDGTHHFFKNCEKFVSADYQPTLTDALKVRRKTTGIIEYKFSAGGNDIKLVDVGGQVSERKKNGSLFSPM